MNKSVTHPITLDMLQMTCHMCSINHSKTERYPDPLDHQSGDFDCPPICPHRCHHLKVISNEDVLQDSGWSLDTMKLVTCLHSTGDIWTMHSLKQLAIRQGLVILHFRLKLANKDNKKIQFKHACK